MITILNYKMKFPALLPILKSLILLSVLMTSSMSSAQDIPDLTTPTKWSQQPIELQQVHEFDCKQVLAPCLIISAAALRDLSLALEYEQKANGAYKRHIIVLEASITTLVGEATALRELLGTSTAPRADNATPFAYGALTGIVVTTVAVVLFVYATK